MSGQRDRSRVFLLSPANCNGVRARMVVAPTAGFPLAQLRRQPRIGLEREAGAARVGQRIVERRQVRHLSEQPRGVAGGRAGFERQARR